MDRKNEKFIFGEIINLENEMYAQTKLLIEQVLTKNVAEIPIIEFRLSEIFSLKCTLDLYLRINYDYQHYELSSLLTFWEKTFHELKEVIAEDDSNTSWLHSQFENYSGQHEIVDKMVRAKFTESR